MEHTNINVFVSMELKLIPPVVFYQWCKRGSLDDFIRSCKLDLTLQISLLGDLTQVTRHTGCAPETPNKGDETITTFTVLN